MRCVHGQSGPALPAVLAAAAVLTALTASPAEARRRAHHGGGGGYNPPYAAMVVDAKTGRVMHAVNEDALRHPASITKVMTLYLLFEQLERGKMDLDTPLTVSANAARQPPSKLGVRPGSTVTVEEAIKALVTKSANDIACAIGENIAGSEPAFAEMMTRKAHALGMSRTHYANASGLPDSDQITTARDLTILARAVQDRFPKYYRYFQTRSFAFKGRVIGNHNHLLGRVEGVDGIKTGYTRDSGFNLMTSARTGDRHIVAVVLGGKSVASRDNIMAKLVQANLPVAYAGARTSAPVVEVAERPRPAVVAERPVATRTLVASADEDDAVETTNSTGQPLDIAPRGGATPKWRAGAAGMPASAQAYAPAAAAPAFPAPGGKYASRLPASEPGEVRAPAPREAAAPAPKPVTVSPWVIQLGAMDDEGKAKSMLAEARQRGGGALGKAAPFTEKVTHGGTTLYRARFSGFSEAEAAQDACRALKRNGFTCFATRS
ncbi:D-alanyl-D-alanine carboxypeptidase [Methylobacterium terricola]|uniref:D-alanyl-D-alanine carboxypeptidase n=1 Tax=Methylobacterium terricola TaxID=2583531 RepID=A0A5C4LBZ5_9HYPH|nr:D-alanyl-D-alanine carboxypeptidase [Methylobacterium terricola]TNC10352.1 D-alanyl-D-alanine carboxypeptidase [Methylobacterium terricola]